MLTELRAKPIWFSGSGKNKYIEFKRTFTLESVQKAVFYIIVDTEYVLYLNGRFVNCNQYADYPEHKVYDGLDVTNWLHCGDNTMEILGYFQGESSAARMVETPMLMYALDAGTVRVVSDENTLCRVCGAYLSGETERVSPQLSYTFHYDARREGQNPWEPAAVMQGRSKSFEKRPVQKYEIDCRRNGVICAQGSLLQPDIHNKTTAQLMQTAYLSAKTPSDILETDCFGPIFTEKGVTTRPCDNGVYLVFDLKEETAGYFEMDISAFEGTVIQIGYGEHLHDMRVRTHIGGRNFAFDYICKQGRQVFTHRVKRIAGRYLQMHILSGQPVTVYGVGICACVYPVEIDNGVICGDRLLRKIYDVSVHTLQLCMHEHYEDCPWREQALYAMDARIQMLCGYYVFKNFDMQRASLKLLADSQNEAGDLALTAPGKADFTIPSFTLIWVVAWRDYFIHSDDRNGTKQLFACADRIMNHFWEMFDGVAIKIPNISGYWNFYEWADGMHNSPWGKESLKIPKEHYDAPIQLFMIMAMQAFREILVSFDMYTEAEIYQNRISIFQKQVNDVFWNEQNQLYQTYSGAVAHFSELTQALVLCTHTADEERASVLRAALSGKNHMVPATLSCMLFKYEALLQDEKYKQYVFDDIASIWGAMLFEGATSFWETANGGYDFENAGSLCHGWSAIPAYFIKKYYNEREE